MIDSFQHERPTDLSAALMAVAEGGTPYVGGTELIAAMKMGLLAPERLVDLKAVSELDGITVEGTVVHIGPATRHADVEKHPDVRSRLPVLATALRNIGNPRVRWQGTVGGNLCFAEPRSDLIPVLIALDATLSLRSVRDERSMAASDFVTDAFTVDRADNELLVRISIDTDGIDYQAYSRVQYMERPTLGVAVVGRHGGWRVCVGSLGYIPHLTTAPTLDDVEPAAIVAGIDPIVDATGSADYKRHLAGIVLRRALAEARSHA